MTERLPLTPLQQGMLFHSLRSGSTSASAGTDTEHIIIELDEVLDVDRFVDSWRTVIAEFEILRSRFVWDGGTEPARIVEEQVALDVTVVDGLDEPAFRRLVATDRATPFDLGVATPQRLIVTCDDTGERPGTRWRILWSFHHILLDGRSFPIVLRSVFDHYRHGHEPSETAPISKIVEHWHTSSDEQAQKEFWTAELAGIDATTPISVGVDRPDLVPQPTMVAVDRILTDSETNDLRDAVASVVGDGTASVTLNTLVQAAWALVLHRYTSARSVVFGSTRANRHIHPDADEAVGLLINTVPFRVDIDRHTPATSLLRQVARRHRSLREVETTPLHLIPRWLSDSEDRNPGSELFDSLVMFDEASLDVRLDDLGGRFTYEGQTNLPITLLAYANPKMELRLEFDRRRFDLVAGGRLLDQFIVTLKGLATAIQEGTTVGEVPYRTEGEQVLLRAMNDTERTYADGGATLVDLLDRQADATPDAIALRHEDDEITYREFTTRARALARDLTDRGVRRGDVVAVAAERSIELLVAVHGIVRAGAAYTPLDPTQPESRLVAMAEDAGAVLVITTGSPSLRLTCCPGLDLDGWRPTGRTGDGAVTAPRPEDPAYVIFTSGSTGRPKGVVNQHRGIVNRLLWMQETFPIDGDDVVLHKTPYTFDVSVWELFWPLITGACLAIAPPEAHRDPSELARLIDEHRVTTMHFVPSMLDLFLRGEAPGRLPSLRQVFCSGEALTRDLQDRALTELSHIELHNLYGPTEAAVDVTWWRCDPASPLSTVPIGRPIANTTMHVLDHDLQPVPLGATGELFIGGVQVAQGYVSRPELTAERFLDSVTTVPAAGRLYRTGDLGRRRPDGAIEYLGRTDHQVKVNGLRIELGEIEAALASHPSVSNSVVVDRDDPQGGRCLVAYVVTTNKATEADLRDHLGGHLPGYMVPSTVVLLDELPLTASGKVNRKQLPEPRSVNRSVRLAASAPSDGLEAEVGAIWADLLGIEGCEVDRTTPFFESGGHSLLTIRLAGALSERFGRHVAVTDLIDHATVAAQARFIAGTEGTGRLASVGAAATQRRNGARRRQQRAKRRATTQSLPGGGTS